MTEFLWGNVKGKELANLWVEDTWTWWPRDTPFGPSRRMDQHLEGWYACASAERSVSKIHFEPLYVGIEMDTCAPEAL